jgi:hypothetical protein
MSPSRRLSTPLKRKREVVRSVSQAVTEAEKENVMMRYGVGPREVKRYKVTLEKNAARPALKRRPLTARRLSGAGRRTALTTKQEMELFGWIIGLRRGPARLRVSEMMIQREAKRRWRIKAGQKWVQGFMRS